jgi:DNA-binding response OmpR family regulator
MGIVTAAPRILVAEDSAFLADMIGTYLKETRWEAVGPVFSVEAALRLAKDERVDAAILDIRLRDADIFPVACLLTSRSVPFLFLTGVDERAVPLEFSAAPCVSKPFEWSTVQSHLRCLLNRGGPDR